MSRQAILGFLLIFGLTATPASARLWTSASGTFKVEAEIAEIRATGVVVLRCTDGKMVEVRIDQLSPADQAFIRQQPVNSPPQNPLSDASPAADPKDALPKEAPFPDIAAPEKSAADWKFTSANAKEAVSEYQEATKKLEDAYEDHRKINLAKLRAAMNVALKEQTQAGNLDEAVKIKAALTSLADGDEPPLPEDEPGKTRLPHQHPAERSRWFVLFRSFDPSVWNSDSKQTKRYAVSVNKAPDEIKFLKLKRIDTNATVIIPMTKNQLGSKFFTGTYGWNGTKAFDQQAYHLGIVNKQWQTKKVRGPISIATTGHPAADVSGWGFGHRAVVSDRQGYSWAGQEINSTIIEISVTSSSLTDVEVKLLPK